MFDVNYIYRSIKTECIVTCAECGQKRRYFRGELIFKTNYKSNDKSLGRGRTYRFCSHSCRAKWIRNKKETGGKNE